MKYFLIVLILFSFGCKKSIEKKETETKAVVTNEYELIISKNQKGLLILFPGGGGSPENIKKEFKIIEKANKHGVSVLLMNFTNKLWIEDADCEKITAQIEKAIQENGLKIDNIYIGGMSLGGTVSLSITQYLTQHSSLQPKGAFIIDSPIDLYSLYLSSIKDLKRKDFSEQRLAEPKWIVSYFEEKFGKDSLLINIEKVAPFTLKTKNFKNISVLKNSKIRFYIEPDAKWLKENRQTDFESSNAYSIQEMYKVLKSNHWKNVQLIETKNKGFRANGDRNPHSWSIVDVDDLLKWMLE